MRSLGNIPSPANSPAMARIVELLVARGPLTTAEIARGANLSAKTLSGGGYLKRLHQAGMIHVAGWHKNCSGFTTPIFGAGKARDCPRPQKFRRADRDSPGMAKIVGALRRHGDLGSRELAAAAELSHNTLRSARYLDILVEQGRIHILGWRRNERGPMSAVYRAGPGDNATRPPAYSAATKSRRWRERQQEAPPPAPQSPSLWLANLMPRGSAA